MQTATKAVKVVPLEWAEEDGEPNWWTAWHADARLGYEVRSTVRGKVRRRHIGENWTDFDGDIDDAKADAQADFERRILACISPTDDEDPTTPASDPPRQAIEALKACVKEMSHNHPGDSSYWAAVEAAEAIIAQSEGR